MYSRHIDLGADLRDDIRKGLPDGLQWKIHRAVDSHQGFRYALTGCVFADLEGLCKT